jgi:HTH-type transcriptional regulator, glycine betaine synthesis regulator
MNNTEWQGFIDSWGAMGEAWGINRSIARVHALLLLSSEAVDLDTVAQRLNISRGNASMCLKELRNWGVIKPVHVSGDRRDFYEVEPDMWHMFFHIARERKKREFDPALAALTELLAGVGVKEDQRLRERLAQMEDLLTSADRLANRFLADETQAKHVFKFLKTFTP